MLSKSNSALIQREAEIPGLRTLLDPDVFIDFLRRFYPESTITNLNLSYVRYKPNTSCLVGYQIVSGEGVVDVYATAYQSLADDKIRKAKHRPQIAGMFGPGRMILEEKKIVVSIFPNDNKLRSLRRLADPSLRKRLLRKTLSLKDELGDVDILKLAYKPERRFVAKLISQNKGITALKMYTKTGFSVPLWNAKAFHSTEALRLPRLLGHNERHNSLIFEWLPGKTLMELIVNPEFKLSIMNDVGAALSELHKQDPDVIRSWSVEDETPELLALAETIGFMCPNLAIRADQLAQKLVTQLNQIPHRSQPIHGDFYAKQVIVNKNQISFIDFDGATRGNPAADLGNFIAHLIRYELRTELQPNRVAPLADALLQGYLSTDKGKLDPELDLFTALALFKIAPHSFRHQEPNWAERTEALLNEAHSYIEKHQTSGSTEYLRSTPPLDRLDKTTSNTRIIDLFNVISDPKMPFIIPALDPEHMFGRLKTIFQSVGIAREFNLKAIRVTRYKRGRRCLVEYDLHFPKCHDHKDDTITIIGKARSKGAHYSAYKLARIMWNGDFGPNTPDDICVPEPIAIIPELHMWLQYKVDGVVATHAIQSASGPSLSIRIAEAISKVYQAHLPTTKLHTVDDELYILQDRLAKVAECRPEWKTRLHRIMDQCALQAKSLPKVDPCGIHRDFYPDQVIINGSKIYLIDFDLFCEGDPSLDIGNFIGHLIEQRIRTEGKETNLKDCEDAFKERYIELNGEPIRHTVNTYTILTLARHISISTLFPDRREYTERILKLCEQYLYRNTKDPTSPSHSAETLLKVPEIAS